MAALVLAGMVGGCDWFASRPRPIPVPKPLDQMLPREIHLHPLTATETLPDQEGAVGLRIRVVALDAWGNPTKAFGQFRFELYDYVPNNRDPKGTRLAVWNVDVEDARTNKDYWEDVHRWYNFRLGWHQPVALGDRFVVAASFESSFGPRLFDEQDFPSGR